MFLEEEQVIGFYGVKSGNKVKLHYINHLYETHEIEGSSTYLETSPITASLRLNAYLNPDIDETLISIDTLRDVLSQESSYNSDNRIFLFKNGDFIDIKHVFIEREEIDFFDENKYEYTISCEDLKGNTIQLFTTPTGEYHEDSTIQMINFEVERLLQMEGITIIDEEDAFTLFKLAVEYMDGLHNQVEDFEVEFDL